MVQKQLIGGVSMVILTVALSPATVHANAKVAVRPHRTPSILSNVFSRRKQQPEPPSYKFWSELTSTAPTDTAAAPTTTPTPVAELAGAFENDVLQSPARKSDAIRGGAQRQDINMPQLLHACRKFEAAMRVLGEKQVANVMHGHICKVENLYRSAPANHRNTMRALLKYEKGLGIHPTVSSTKTTASSSEDEDNGQRLNDSSAAMGLLRIGRSIAFNCKWYCMITENDNQNPTDAALTAYESVLQRYHGWVLRRLATAGMKSTIPPRPAFLARLGGFDEHEDTAPHQEKTTIRDMQRLTNAWQPLISNWQQTFQDLELDDTRRA